MTIVEEGLLTVEDVLLSKLNIGKLPWGDHELDLREEQNPEEIIRELINKINQQTNYVVYGRFEDSQRKGVYHLMCKLRGGSNA